MVVSGRLVKPRVAPSDECECEWLSSPVVLAHCRSQVGVTDIVDSVPFDTLVFCTTHSFLDMNFIDVDHM